MRKLVLLAVLAFATAAFATSPAWAGSPHFVFIDVSRIDSSLVVSGKEAGLGNEEQVHIVVSATAECINPGGNHPKAANKETVTAEGDFPVQNGKALFSLTLTPSFAPSCSPPMTIQFTDVTVTDTTSGISESISGTL